MTNEFTIEQATIGGSGLAILRNWGLSSAIVESELTHIAGHLASIGGPTVKFVEISERPVEAGYAEWASVYDDPGNPIVLADERIVWPILDSYPVGLALDAACGTGRHAAHLASLGHRVVGFDSTPEMLDVAKTKVPNTTFHVARMDGIPLDSASCDLAVCSLAVTHDSNPAPAIAELARVVRPGGHVVISDVHPMMVGLGVHAFYWGANGMPGVVRNHLHLHSTYLDAFTAAGLEVRSCIEPLWTEEEASMMPWINQRPELWESAFAGLPMLVVWETVKTR